MRQEIRPAKEDIENHKINTKLVHDENETLAHKIKKMSHELNELKLYKEKEWSESTKQTMSGQQASASRKY